MMDKFLQFLTNIEDSSNSSLIEAIESAYKICFESQIRPEDLEKDFQEYIPKFMEKWGAKNPVAYKNGYSFVVAPRDGAPKAIKVYTDNGYVFTETEERYGNEGIDISGGEPYVAKVPIEDYIRHFVHILKV